MRQALLLLASFVDVGFVMLYGGILEALVVALIAGWALSQYEPGYRRVRGLPPLHERKSPMKPLTPSQRDALLVADARNPLPVYAGNANGKAFVKPGAAGALVDRGLLAPQPRSSSSTFRITHQGRAVARELWRENTR